MNKSYRISILIVILLIGLNTAYAQTTIWSVDFETGYSDNDQTAQDNNSPTGADWTKTGSPTNWWRVETNNAISGSFCMNGRNTDGVMTWTSESIDISNYSDVSISIDIGEQACESTDIIETFYDIGSGNVEFGDGNGNGNFGSSTNTITGLNSTSLTIVVTLNNNGGNERLFFDNIVVSGTINNGHLGPGGIGNTDGTGNLSLWLDANQGISSSGTAVTQWNDQSGHNNHATPPLTANRPTYDATGTNNHPLITFDGSNDYLTVSDDNSLDLTTWSIFVITKVNTHKNYNAFVVKGSDNSENYEFLSNYPSTGNIHYPVLYTNTARSVDSEPSETISTSTYGVYQLDYDQSNFNVYIDGALTETDSETRTPQTNSNELYIGNEQGVSGRNVNADIAEIIIYSSPLNDAERNIIHNVMSAKYGFSLDASNLYDEDDALNGDHDFDVAGIGQAADGSNHIDAQGTGILRVNTPSDLGNSEYLIWGHNNGAMSSSGVTDLPSGLESRVDREWKFSETGDVGTVTISLDLSDFLGSITTSDLRLLIDSDGDGLYSDESGGSIIAGAVNSSGNIYEWTGVSISNNQGLSLGSVDETSTPLPISLLSFDANYLRSNYVEINWITSSELNNQYFQVEKSQDGIDWFLVKEIDGAGNSNKELNYSIIDKTPFSGTSYYRLRQIDFDGKTELFDPVAVQSPFVLNGNLEESLGLYPNPGNGSSIYIELVNFEPNTYQINVMAETGKLVLNREVFIEEDVMSLELELLHGMVLSRGTYFIRVSSFDKVVTKKYIVY